MFPRTGTPVLFRGRTGRVERVIYSHAFACHRAWVRWQDGSCSLVRAEQLEAVPCPFGFGDRVTNRTSDDVGSVDQVEPDGKVIVYWGRSAELDRSAWSIHHWSDLERANV